MHLSSLPAIILLRSTRRRVERRHRRWTSFAAGRQTWPLVWRALRPVEWISRHSWRSSRSPMTEKQKPFRLLPGEKKKKQEKKMIV